MIILKPICLLFLYERPPCLSGMCSNDDDDDDDDDDCTYMLIQLYHPIITHTMSHGLYVSFML